MYGGIGAVGLERYVCCILGKPNCVPTRAVCVFDMKVPGDGLKKSEEIRITNFRSV